MATQIVSKLSFVTKIANLMKATADDDSPIPGYLYNDICQKITFSSGENCEMCVGFLVERLEHESTHVKLKALKLIKYIVENGHTNFRLGLMKKSSGIHEATKYSGPPDPLHGDVPYKMVRKTAKSVLECLFTIDNSTQTQLASQTDKPAIGTTGIGSISNTKQRSSGKMEGFGSSPNTQFERSFGENIKDSILKMAEKLGTTSDDVQRKLLSDMESGGGGYTPAGYVPFPLASVPAGPASTVTVTKQASPPKHIPGKAGGGWDDSDDDDTDDVVNDDVISDKGRTRSTNSCSIGVSEQRLESEPAADFVTEQTTVASYIDNVTNRDSMLLKRSQLKDFLKECAGINCDKVMDILNERLLSPSSQDEAVMRCLMLLEVLVYSDLINQERLASTCREGLLTTFQGRSGQQKSKARKLIRILEKITHQKDILPLHQETDLIVAET